jgi:hypothetical protein
VNRQCDPLSSVAEFTKPTDLRLKSAPNPFNPSTVISYEVPHSSWVNLAVYTVSGQRVDVLVDEYQNAGEYRIRWNAMNAIGENLASGVYLAVLEVAGSTKTCKLVYLK